MSEADVRLVQAWQEAVNAGDVERLVALSDADVEVGGPRGSGRGAQLLREWMDRAGISLHPRRVFARGGTVVVEQLAVWRPTEPGEDASRQEIATVFRVRDGRVDRVIRHPDLESALMAAGLSASDEVRHA